MKSPIMARNCGQSNLLVQPMCLVVDTEQSVSSSCTSTADLMYQSGTNKTFVLSENESKQVKNMQVERANVE